MLLVIATNFLIFIGDDVLSRSILKHFQLTTGPQKEIAPHVVCLWLFDGVGSGFNPVL